MNAHENQAFELGDAKWVRVELPRPIWHNRTFEFGDAKWTLEEQRRPVCAKWCASRTTTPHLASPTAGVWGCQMGASGEIRRAPHRRTRCDCSSAPARGAPACRRGSGSAWSGPAPQTSRRRPASSSAPARPGERAAAPPAGETDSPRGRRWSPPTDRPAGGGGYFILKCLNLCVPHPPSP